MTPLAQEYHLSRTLLSHLLSVATCQLEALLSDDKPHVHNGQGQFAQLLCLCRLAGQCALASLASLVKARASPPNSVGDLSACCHSDGRLLPSPRSRGAHTVVLYLSDALCASHTPLVLPRDAHSTAILTSERATERVATPWPTHVAPLDEHGVHHIGLASERGVGLGAGSQAADGESLWGSEQGHAWQALLNRRRPCERKADAALGKADDAAAKCEQATSASTRHKRLPHSAHAPHAGEHASARDEQLDLLLVWSKNSKPA
jgi:hypothetical protein